MSESDATQMKSGLQTRGLRVCVSLKRQWHEMLEALQGFEGSTSVALVPVNMMVKYGGQCVSDACGAAGKIGRAHV